MDDKAIAAKHPSQTRAYGDIDGTGLWWAWSTQYPEHGSVVVVALDENDAIDQSEGVDEDDSHIEVAPCDPWGLAAENAALRAEVERLRAQRDAFRAALTEPAGWPGVDILREALAPPPDAVPEVLDDLARRAGMVLDALAAALAALEAP